MAADPEVGEVQLHDLGPDLVRRNRLGDELHARARRDVEDEGEQDERVPGRASPVVAKQSRYRVHDVLLPTIH